MDRRCAQCDGSGELICEGCGGRGQVQAFDGEDMECHSCDGLGTIDCPACNGVGAFVFTYRGNVQNNPNGRTIYFE
ncbi:MAG: transcriptional regulator [Deltaproteobacteria bacterium]|nr:transcriptional regulator [Deltaproteobacteria bacterium]MBW1960263.1 transcriptional regulator [Deltaproteobacteria bacterium]MBW1994914.1 transcriptional regulator [Deltaproteobacteria bacterium]MBW2150324.1 transcriptional regulator [Deltaproteobacteria bacterium]